MCIFFRLCTNAISFTLVQMKLNEKQRREDLNGGCKISLPLRYCVLLTVFVNSVFRTIRFCVCVWFSGSWGTVLRVVCVYARLLLEHLHGMAWHVEASSCNSTPPNLLSFSCSKIRIQRQLVWGQIVSFFLMCSFNYSFEFWREWKQQEWIRKRKHQKHNPQSTGLKYAI